VPAASRIVACTPASTASARLAQGLDGGMGALRAPPRRARRRACLPTRNDHRTQAGDRGAGNQQAGREKQGVGDRHGKNPLSRPCLKPAEPAPAELCLGGVGFGAFALVRRLIEHLGDEKSQFERLFGIEARVAMRVVAIA